MSLDPTSRPSRPLAGRHPARCDTRRAVRNPMLALPAVARLASLDGGTRAALRAVLLDLALDAGGRADLSWRRHKAPMAAYWTAVAVYARHLARVLR